MIPHSRPARQALDYWRAYRALRAKVEAGSRRYVEQPWRIENLMEPYGPDIGSDRIGWLKGEIAREKRRFRRGHYSYDLNRHLGLLQCLRGALRITRAAA